MLDNIPNTKIEYLAEREWYEINYKNKQMMVITYAEKGKCITDFANGFFEAETITTKKNVSDIEINRRIEKAWYVISKIEAITSVLDVVYADIFNIDNVCIRNGVRDGVEEERKDQRTKITVYLNVMDSVRVLFYYLSNDYSDDVNRIVEDILKNMQFPMIDNTKCTTNLLFVGAAFGFAIHESIGHLLEKDIYEKYHYLRDNKHKIDTKCCFDIIDGPIEPLGIIKSQYDDNGCMVRDKYLVRNGCICNLLGEDVFSGNYRRQSFKNISIPRMSNTIIMPNGFSDDSFCMSHGIVLQDVVGGLVDYRTGHIKLVSYNAYQVVDGKEKAFMNLVNIETDAINLINSIVAMDNKVNVQEVVCRKQGQQVSVCVGSPNVMVEDIEVS